MSDSENSGDSRDSGKVPQEKPVSVSSPTTSSEQVAETADHSKVIEQARKFLEKDEIKHTEEKQKVAFLQTKGLSSDEIKDLLKESEKQEALVFTASNASSLDKESSSGNIDTVSRGSSVPPIITYPEFLVNPSPNPAPLLTTNHLLTILYSTSFLAATLYGTLEYVVSPMLLKLIDCRHELFSSTLSKVDQLSQKLEGLVSEIPFTVTSYSSKENKEIDDDPTELFHRDIGIQTSLPSSPHQPKNEQFADEPIILQATNLCGLNTYLQDISNTLNEETHCDGASEDVITDLRKYLNSIAYPTPSISNYESIYTQNGTMAGYISGNNVDGDVSEAAKVKKEIKGMKGLLLSARTFPGLKTGLFQR